MPAPPVELVARTVMLLDHALTVWTTTDLMVDLAQLAPHSANLAPRTVMVTMPAPHATTTMASRNQRV